MPARSHWTFARRYIREPGVVGAVAPSSRALARALCAPYRQCDRPAKVLEVGAGTGSFTRFLGATLKDTDELDICEIVPEFVDVLQRDVLSGDRMASAVRAGRVRLIQGAVQSIRHENHYDFIISGLPLTAFGLSDLRDVLAVIRRSLKPDGVFSYFEYVGLRRLSRMFALGKKRARVRLVSDVLTDTIRQYQFDRRTVLANLPPAHARHLRFGDTTHT